MKKLSKFLPRSPRPIIKNRLPGFDEIYYLYWYPDVRLYRGDPMTHYLVHGWREGRDPSAGFSTDGYLEANPDVAATNINPLKHFVENGLAEGRKGWAKDPKAEPPRPRAAPADEQMLLAGPATPSS